MTPELLQIATIALNLFLAWLGACFGLILADADHNVPFIKHRSALTHGVIWPVLAYKGGTPT